MNTIGIFFLINSSLLFLLIGFWVGKNTGQRNFFKEIQREISRISPIPENGEIEVKLFSHFENGKIVEISSKPEKQE